jgi:hypothetical protein
VTNDNTFIAHNGTYRAVPHSEIIHRLHETLGQAGIDVNPDDKHYSISKDGGKMFGMWMLENRNGNGIKPAIGFRNSYDKSMSIMFGAGTKVFVCDNLAFSAEWISIRKHTSGLDNDEMKGLVQDAVAQVMKTADSFLSWHLALKKIPLNQQQIKIMTYNALSAEVFPPSKFAAFEEAFKAERMHNDVEEDPTMYHFHAAITRMMREEPLFKIADCTGKLTRLIDRSNAFQIS